MIVDNFDGLEYIHFEDNDLSVIRALYDDTGIHYDTCNEMFLVMVYNDSIADFDTYDDALEFLLHILGAEP